MSKHKKTVFNEIARILKRNNAGKLLAEYAKKDVNFKKTIESFVESEVTNKDPLEGVPFTEKKTRRPK